MGTLITPYGGALRELLATGETLRALRAELPSLRSLTVTPDEVCDLELLLCGAFSPLGGYLTKASYDRVVREMRLVDGTLWPIPIVLGVDAKTAPTLQPGERVALRDHEGLPLAILTVGEVWKPDLEAEARGVYGTTDPLHPAVQGLRARDLAASGLHYVGGPVQGIALPRHYDFASLRHTPAELRAHLERNGFTRVVAYHTRSPMFRAHRELAVRAAIETDAHLLVHPALGAPHSGELNYHGLVRGYQRVMPHFPPGLATLSLLPLRQRLAGPRGALWHLIIRRNYGCSHVIVARDHGSPMVEFESPFYEPYAAQKLACEYAAEVGVETVACGDMVYNADTNEYVFASELPTGARVLDIGGGELQRRLDFGLEIPEWFAWPEVVEELRRTNPPRSKQGFTVFCTGLSGSGKSTISRVLQMKLLEDGRRQVTLLDGDLLRKHLTSELGFSREHRSLNVRRIGWVASEITKNGGAVIAAPIAPYEDDRRAVRDLVSPNGSFIEVYVATPLEVCESRDPKGFYAKARKGLIKDFTGIDAPYEEPSHPEIRIDTSKMTIEQAAETVMSYLRREGFL